MQGRNFRIEVMLMLLAIGFGLWLRISPGEWQTVIISSGMVLGAETINSAIELVCDLAQPQWDERVRRIKDLSSGAVSIVSLAAAMSGAIIFLPKLLLHYGFSINTLWALW